VPLHLPRPTTSSHSPSQRPSLTTASGSLARGQYEQMGLIRSVSSPTNGLWLGRAQAAKGYGLHTILMHQFRGLVVWRRQKKATGARSGCGTSGSAPSRGSSRPGGDGVGLLGPGCSVIPASRAGAAADEGGELLSAMSAWCRVPWGAERGTWGRG
jgi:hypothetical protein